MIYKQIGTHTHVLAPLLETKDNTPTGDMQWLQNYKALTVKAGTEQEIAQFKQDKAEFFIAGEMAHLARSNENLLNRSLLIIDFDIIHDEEKFKSVVNDLFHQVTYYLYPSISYGFKGIRYRLVLLPDRSFNQADYKAMLETTQAKMKIRFDSNASQWSQVMGLPIVNGFSSELDLSGRIYNAGKPFNVDEIVNQAPKPTLTVDYNQSQNQSFIPAGRSFPLSYATKTLNDLIDPITEGERNSRLTQYCGRLFKARINAKVIYELLNVKNSYCTPPLDDEELNKIFMSIANKERSKGSVRREERTGASI